ncbi:hypothetical protein HMPREF9413_3940 [Paenibacillus sp. HGF7]|nr:hypothetical protein HMPREF9413_3940 [Paenibacillus sp. HGF7]
MEADLAVRPGQTRRLGRSPAGRRPHSPLGPPEILPGQGKTPEPSPVRLCRSPR